MYASELVVVVDTGFLVVMEVVTTVVVVVMEVVVVVRERAGQMEMELPPPGCLRSRIS